MKKLLTLILILLIIFGVATRVLSLNKDFAAEETDFVKPAEAIKGLGHPIFYYSEQIPSIVALWHPPMYIYLLSLIELNDYKEISIRSVNVAFSILIALIIFLFCKNLFNKKDGKLIGLIASAFFLINYFVLSSSMIIDIDVISSFAVLGFVYGILMNYKTEKISYLIFAGVSLFLVICNRYPIAGLVYISCGVYFLIKKELRKNIKNYFLTGLIPGLIFIFVWTLYSTLAEPGNLFSFLIHNAKFGAEQFYDLKIYISSFMLNMAQFIRLFTLPATILMILAVWHFIKEKNPVVRMLLIYTLSIFILFAVTPRPAYGYPRYFLSMFPGIAILISLYIYEKLKEEPDKKLMFLGVLAFVVSLEILLFLNPQLTAYHGNGLIKSTNLPDFVFNMLASLPIIFVFPFKSPSREKAAIIILIALLLSYSFFFDLKLASNNLHVKETGEYIKLHTGPNETIISPKAVAYYAERKFYASDNNKPQIEKLSATYLYEYILKSYENRAMDDEFFWPEGYYGAIYPALDSEEPLKNATFVVTYHKINNTSPEKVIGDFYIYRLQTT